MNRVYIINDIVEFHADQHILIARGGNSETILLNTPASRCLHLLIQRQHKITSQQDFFDEVWSKHGAYVSANTFYQNISILRRGLLKAGLGDEIVKTVSRKGLALTASTTVIELDNPEPLSRDFIQEEIKDVETIKQEREKPFKEHLNLLTPCTPEGDKKGVDKYLPEVQIEGIMMLTGIAVFILIVITGYNFFQSKESAYFSHHQPVRMAGECKFYTEEKNNSYGWLMSFIDKNNIICDEKGYPYNYITTYEFSNRFSLIKCNNDINRKSSSDCISYYSLQKEK